MRFAQWLRKTAIGVRWCVKKPCDMTGMGLEQERDTAFLFYS
jgi:uncharacterized protein YecE (DUF72 family)